MLVFPTTAQATTRWSTGVLVSGVPSPNAWTWGMYRSTCSSYLGLGAVKLVGDYLYVKDTCADGHSAFVEWRDAKYTNERWICRNGRGKGTIVRCNFDWPERGGILIVGMSDGNKVYVRDHGASIAMNPERQG